MEKRTENQQLLWLAVLFFFLDIMSKQLFTNFRIAKFRFYLAPRGIIRFPRYQGSTLRGGLGHALHKVCCSFDYGKCRDCLLKEKCAYAYIFETSPFINSNKLSKNLHLPQPFVIEPSLDNKEEYRKGELYNFDLILIGKGIEHMLYLLVAFKELGNIGLGRGWGKFELERVEAINELREEKIEIYSSAKGIINNSILSFDFAEIIEYHRDMLDSRELIIEFLTPMRLKFNNSYVSKPEFHILFRNVLRRLSSLAYFHCDEDLEESIDFKRVIEKSREVEVEEMNTRWLDWERYSSRQDDKMRLGGFIGEVVYRGELKEFIPYILLGEQVHIGKNCTFGLGKYRVRFGKEGA